MEGRVENEAITNEGSRLVAISPHIFKAPKMMEVPQGVTIAGIVRRMYDAAGVPMEIRDNRLLVEIDGEPVERDRWHLVPAKGQHVMVSVPVHGGGGDGGKDPLRTVMMIAVVVAATIVTFYAGGSGGWLAAAGMQGASAISATAAAMGMAVSCAGMFLVNAIAPIRSGSVDSVIGGTGNSTYADSPTYSISPANNTQNPFGPVPVVLGKHKVYPVYGTKPYTELVGQDEYIRMLFIWGDGPLKIEDIKIGDTLLSEYSNYTIETREGWDTDADITLIDSSVVQTAVNVNLLATSGRIIRTASPNVDELSAEICFPQGLAYISDDGSRVPRNVYVRLEYREVGAASWTVITAVGTLQVAPATWYLKNSYALFTPGTNSVYVSDSGYLSLAAGTAARTGFTRLAEVVYHEDATSDPVVRSFTSVNNLSPAGFTGAMLYIGTTYSSNDTLMLSSGTFGAPAYPFNITSQTTSALRFGRRWAVDKTKSYEIALTRITVDSTDDRAVDSVTWTYLRSITHEQPISFPAPLAMTALRIKATNQLSGVIDNLNAIVSSYGPTWDSETETWEASPTVVTQNPAALYRMVLTHQANARRRTFTQLDDAGLGEWYEFCETAGYKFNMVRDSVTSVWSCLADIAAAGRAAISQTDGLWSVIADVEGRPVSQHITPRNSWGFSSEKVFFTMPHGFRVTFINEEKDYAKDERIVLDDGYTEETATLFEGIEFPGVTDPDLIWKFGRFHIAQARLRPETYSVYMDFEHLKLRRGCKVKVAHDVPMWG